MKNPRTLQDLSLKIKTPEVYDFILERALNIDKDIPKKGILAGQAVVSAIVEYLHMDAEINPVYNDLDIFLPVSSKFSHYATSDLFKMFGKRELNNSSEVQFEQEIESNGAYSHLEKAGIEALIGNRILGSITSGLINKTIVSANTTNGDIPVYLDEARQIISNFDINSTKAGIVLNDDTKTVFFTVELLQFLYTKQIEITNWSTPVHSLIRLVKKQKELGKVYANIEEFKDVAIVYANLMKKMKNGECYREMENPDESSSVDYHNQERLSNTPLDFGKKFASLFENNPLDGIEMIKNESGNFHTLQFVGDPEIKAEEIGSRILRYDDGAFFGGKKSVMIENMSRGIIPRESDTTRGFGAGYPTMLIGKMPELYKSLKFSKKSVKLNVAKTYSGKNRIPLFKLTRKGQRSILDLKDIDPNIYEEYMKYVDFIHGLKSHNSLSQKYFSIHHSSMKEIVRKVKIIKELESETRVCIGFLEAYTVISDEDFTKEKIKPLIAEYLKEADAELKKRMPDSQSKYFKFKELVTKNELRDEGSRLDHCVGGYGSSIKGGNAIIISISPKQKNRGEAATMEIRPSSSEDGKYKISQYHGIKNKRFFLSNDIYDLLKEINKSYKMFPLYEQDISSFDGYSEDLNIKSRYEEGISKNLMMRFYIYEWITEKKSSIKTMINKVRPKWVSSLTLIKKSEVGRIRGYMKEKESAERLGHPAPMLPEIEIEVDEIPF